jgi:parallel beta-helix repeat protein
MYFIPIVKSNEMRTTCLISFTIFFALAGQTIDVHGWPPEVVEIIPQNPTSCDIVVIRLSGTWGDTCKPLDSTVSVVDSNIYFDVIWNYPPDITCLALLTPWKRTRSVGPLAPGMYNVYARVLGVSYIPEEYTWVAEFTITYQFHMDTVYYVDAVHGDDGNDGLSKETAFATIQKGIDTAKSGDTVIVTEGVYTGEGNYDIDFYCKAITVRSTYPDDPSAVSGTVVDCQGYSDSGFYFCSNEDPNSVLAGFTITDGFHGIECRDYSNPTIGNCIVTNNQFYYGDGIFCHNSSPTIINCTISGNSNGMETSYNSNPTLMNCILWGNTNEQIVGSAAVSYSDVQGGRWEPNSQSWIQDNVTSPCIDAGNIHSPIGQEPFPNGGIINMGAFGGTTQASKSYLGEPICEIVVAGDINGDCKVNFLDFRLMALHWLRDENR